MELLFQVRDKKHGLKPAMTASFQFWKIGYIDCRVSRIKDEGKHT